MDSVSLGVPFLCLQPTERALFTYMPSVMVSTYASLKPLYIDNIPTAADG